MSDQIYADQFNQELDRLLGITAQSVNPTPVVQDVQDALLAARRMAGIDLSAENQQRQVLRARLLASISQTPEQTRPVRKSLSSFSRFAAAAAVTLALILLVIFRQPVLAAIAHLFGYGYLPESGFILLSDSRLLAEPVTQAHEDQRLTVTRGVATSERTELWLSFEGEAISLEGAWLELPGGATTTIREWRWLPDDRAPSGGYIQFEPLADDVKKTTLALPQGWRIPLRWLPAPEVDVPGAEVVAPLPTGTLLPNEQAAAQMPLCSSRWQVELCLQAAFSAQDGTHLLLAGKALQPWVRFDTDLLTTDPFHPEEMVLVTDLQKSQYMPSPIQPGLDAAGQQSQRQELLFDLLPSDLQSMVLRIPAVPVQVPAEGSFQVILPDGLTPGQEWDGKWEVTVAGTPLQFTHARLTGDGQTSLQLVLATDALQPVNGFLLTGLSIGRINGISGSYGIGINQRTHTLEINIELVSPLDGTTYAGPVEIGVDSANGLVIGPFEFNFQAPQPQTSVEQTPVVVEGGFVQPVPSEPLPMDAFNFSGRPLQVGDLLFSLQEGEFTTLYAANEANGFKPEVVAVLPGRVAAFFPWPDHSGLDYVTSLPNDDMYLPKARLFSLKLDGSQPVQVLPTLPYLTWLRWSFDGRFLYFETAESGSGVGHRAWVLDSTCRNDPVTCQPKAVDLPQEMRLNQAVWSPNTYQLALHGTSANGLGEVYRMDISNEGEISAPVNLSESPQNDEQWMRWLPDGSGLLSTCAFRPDPNQWDVCQISSQPYSEMVLAQLPAHLVPTDFVILPDGSAVIDRYADKGKAGEVRLVQFSLADSNMITLSTGGDFGLLALEGSGSHLAAIRYSLSREMVKDGPKRAREIHETIDLEVLGLIDGKNTTVFTLNRDDQLQERNISWLVWVK